MTLVTYELVSHLAIVSRSVLMKEEEGGGRDTGGTGTFPFAVNLVTRDYPHLILPDILKSIEKEHIN